MQQRRRWQLYRCLLCCSKTKTEGHHLSHFNQKKKSLLQQRRRRQLYRRLLCCSKTKIEGDDNVSTITLGIATRKKKRLLEQNQNISKKKDFREGTYLQAPTLGLAWVLLQALWSYDDGVRGPALRVISWLCFDSNCSQVLLPFQRSRILAPLPSSGDGMSAKSREVGRRGEVGGKGR